MFSFDELPVDRCDSETLSMTHQLLSQMLGVQRTGVTEVARKFQEANIYSLQTRFNQYCL